MNIYNIISEALVSMLMFFCAWKTYRYFRKIYRSVQCLNRQSCTPDIVEEYNRASSRFIIYLYLTSILAVILLSIHL